MDISENLEKFYTDYQEKAFKLAYGLTGNRSDAEDVVQESFYRAFKNISKFRGESKIYTWLYRIIINVSSDYMKSRNKLPIYSLTEDLGYKLEELIDPNPLNTPEMEVLSNEARKKCLHSLTECLQGNQRKVFCLAITLNLPMHVVAEIMDCSVGYVKGTLYRAKERWFGYMENRCGFIKKSNPCRCNQWVKMGVERGWIKKELIHEPTDEEYIKVRNELMQMKDLRDIYQNLYQERAGDNLSKRIKAGIKNREWENIF